MPPPRLKEEKMGRISEFFFGFKECATCEYYDRCDRNPVIKDYKKDKYCNYIKKIRKENRKIAKKERSR